MAKKIVIIDYKMGNLKSVFNALTFIGESPIISDNIEEIKNAEYLILPGVGAFKDGMKNLKELNLLEILKEQVIANKIPFLGICLGMQLMAKEGEEGGSEKGLDLIDGEVKKFNLKDKSLRIPHVGWNEVAFKKENPLSSNLKDLESFYFVHSYYLTLNENITIGQCDYGGKFTAIIQKDNIFGTQFHPEKSQKPGLQILKNFINYKKC